MQSDLVSRRAKQSNEKSLFNHALLRTIRPKAYLALLISATFCLSVVVTLGQTPQVKPSLHPVAANSSSPNPEASPASADPAPAEPTSYWNQPWATGDWGRRRLDLAEKGINFDFTFTQFVQAMSDTDDSFDHYVNRFDAYVNIDTDKAGLWKGGGIGAHFEIRFGNAPTAIAMVPANAALVTPTSGAGQGEVTSLYVTQKLGKTSSLMVGKINTLDLLAGAPFMGGRGIDGPFRSQSSARSPARS